MKESRPSRKFHGMRHARISTNIIQNQSMAVLRSQIFAQRARGCYAETLPERLGPNDARRRPGQGGQNIKCTRTNYFWIQQTQAVKTIVRLYVYNICRHLEACGA